ncbi:MAG: phosphate ABC transporter permease PstA [Methylococcales bacterium]|nr:phosphate ABC transporter permease PstA [Methylococcales bacterium]
MIKQWFKSGSPWIWMNAAAVSISLILVIGLLFLIAVRGLGHYWPAQVTEYTYQDSNQSTKIMGELVDSTVMSARQARASNYQLEAGADHLVQHLLKVGNRDLTGMDFRWVDAPKINAEQVPENALVIERREWGNFYGYLVALKSEGKIIATGTQAWNELQPRLEKALETFEEIKQLQNGAVGKINYALEKLRLKQRRLEIDHQWDKAAEQDITQQKNRHNEDYKILQQDLAVLYQKIRVDSLVVKSANGKEIEIPLEKCVRIYQPNAMSLAAKIGHYGEKFIEFIIEEPREANTEGGIFPAIFGTVMMVMLMAVIVTPFGVIAAVYLREYAKQGFTTRLIRIAVNNLAGVPSIVYGIFGLGFFVYILGGNIDELFYPESAPSPVFGTPGLMWASLTLALLTLPVVIVSTEEGLSRIPKSIREGSLALGATKAETLWRTVLPMASPAMMTGLILAIARAAGEVAPLMLVGVVKLAPTLPLDGNFPYLHLERKFMHLGFHIYDVGFQSPNVEAARPLVYATSLLLVVVIICLNMFAIRVRNNLREKYRALEG